MFVLMVMLKCQITLSSPSIGWRQWSRWIVRRYFTISLDLCRGHSGGFHLCVRTSACNRIQGMICLAYNRRHRRSKPCERRNGRPRLRSRPLTDTCHSWPRTRRRWRCSSRKSGCRTCLGTCWRRDRSRLEENTNRRRPHIPPCWRCPSFSDRKSELLEMKLHCQTVFSGW